jgi:hypothetical protein
VWRLAITGVTIGLVLLGRRVTAAAKEEPLGRVALIGDSYAVGLGPQLEQLLPEFRYEGHVGTNTWQWAHGVRCGECGAWLREFRPKVVLISLGVNDGVAPDRANYQDLVRMIHGLGARAVWIQPPAAVATPADAFIASLGVQTVPPTTTPLAADRLHPASYGPWAQEIARALT